MISIELENRIDVSVNRRAIAIAAGIEGARVKGVRDIVPAYCSVAVHFDPLRTDLDHLMQVIEDEVRSRQPVSEEASNPIRIPVCYDESFAPDLADVAAASDLSIADVIALHTARSYRVFMIGFLPGFPYLERVDERIAVPRLASPRLRVAAGSVGIAGAQTGIYPIDSPGGWRIIGRTPAVLFGPARSRPFLLQPGNTVRFDPIDRVEFDRLRAEP